jgi:hypothetical protein
MSMPSLFGETNLPQVISRGDVETKFAEFWRAYPRRAGANPKFKAEQSFAKAIKSGEKPETIIAGVRQFATECVMRRTEARFVPMAVTWLNQKRWLDDPDAGLVDPVKPKSLLEMARELRERANDPEPD